MTEPSQEPADLVAWRLATQLRTCVCAALQDAIAGAPADCCIVPGRDVAIADCCAGKAWVRIVRVYRTTSDEFPAATSLALDGGCDDTGFWAVELGVGVARCVDENDDGSDRDCPTDEFAALVQADDRGRVLQAIMCCFAPSARVADIAIGEWQPAGPQGGCTGGEWVLSAMVQPECPCPPDDQPAMRAPFYVDGDDDD